MTAVNQSNINTGPWYKHFWPWYIVFMLSAVIIACIVTVILIIRNPAPMVVDDYYNEGRAINLELNREARALELGITVAVTFNGDRVDIRFASGDLTDRSALRLHFYHPTLDHRDFELMVPHVNDGLYRATLPEAITGNWRIDVEPFHREWRVSDTVRLPARTQIIIEPEDYGI
ncbi:FixH family protein [Aliidiomarina celeris]|uniref:FixH family protein n=1 Tax=Aliidiomarina celeris TaxID=2249428 RepID=UPI000DE83387|nr:FixH family protein [Aliidiomarina celeris]